MKLHETIQNFYVKHLKPLFTIEVLSDDNKWNKIDSVNITEKQQFYRLKTKNLSLLCTKNHIVIDENGNELFAVDSQNHKIKTKYGLEYVISVEKTNVFDHAYDVSLHNGTNHLYLTNGILSHNCVVMDEAAFVPNNVASKVFESIYPVISSSKNSQFIMVSTPNGADPKNLYYELWQKANSGSAATNNEGWKSFRFDWWDVPGRDQKWKENTIQTIGETRFAQEFGNTFLASTTIKKLVPDDIIEKYRVQQAECKALDKDLYNGKRVKIFNEAQDKVYEFKMWHEFSPSKAYLASGDIAEGVGGDSSVLNIWDVTDLGNITQCAMFSSNQVSPTEFAFISVKMLGLYNNPYYVCERNGIGLGYLDTMQITFQYQNLVMEGKHGEAGIFSHVTIKDKVCVWAREMITTMGFGWTFYDKELVEEFTTFCRKDNKGVHLVYSALPPAHDDHIMSWIWACWILHPDIVERYFVCCETFVSQLEKIYPKRLQPLQEYKIDDLKRVTNDPIYREFLDYKEDVMQRLGKALDEEKHEESTDPYFRPQRDQFFHDVDMMESWNNPNAANKDLNSRRTAPTFYIF